MPVLYRGSAVSKGLFKYKTARSGGQNVPSPKHQNSEKCNLTNVLPMIFAKSSFYTFPCGLKSHPSSCSSESP